MRHTDSLRRSAVTYVALGALVFAAACKGRTVNVASGAIDTLALQQFQTFSIKAPTPPADSVAVATTNGTDRVGGAVMDMDPMLSTSLVALFGRIWPTRLQAVAIKPSRARPISTLRTTPAPDMSSTHERHRKAIARMGRRSPRRPSCTPPARSSWTSSTRGLIRWCGVALASPASRTTLTTTLEPFKRPSNRSSGRFRARNDKVVRESRSSALTTTARAAPERLTALVKHHP